jgi:outer membrane biosynthesis protein TonB
MPADFPTCADLVPMANYRHNILVVLIAAAIGAVSAGSVIVSLVRVSPTATEAAPTSLRAIVTAAPAVQPKAVVEERPPIEQTPRPPGEQMPERKIEQLPQPTSEPTPLPKLEPTPQTVPDGTESDHAATAPDAGRQIAMPDEQIGQDEHEMPDSGGVAPHRYHGRVTRFPTPNHW